jgi:hypothetical protein
MRGRGVLQPVNLGMTEGSWKNLPADIREFIGPVQKPESAKLLARSSLPFSMTEERRQILIRHSLGFFGHPSGETGGLSVFWPVRMGFLHHPLRAVGIDRRPPVLEALGFAETLPCHKSIFQMLRLP